MWVQWNSSLVTWFNEVFGSQKNTNRYHWTHVNLPTSNSSMWTQKYALQLPTFWKSNTPFDFDTHPFEVLCCVGFVASHRSQAWMYWLINAIGSRPHLPQNIYFSFYPIPIAEIEYCGTLSKSNGAVWPLCGVFWKLLCKRGCILVQKAWRIRCVCVWARVGCWV